MNTPDQLKQFRKEVYQSAEKSADALMNLLDALSGQTNARSIAELSMEPSFQREYGSVYQAIGDFLADGKKRQEKEQSLLQIIGKYIPQPEKEPYWLFGTDGTPAPREYARTLEDRSFVYKPNVVKGNKPVTIGHHYSIVAHLPERAAGEPNWVVPLLVDRIESQEDDPSVGLEQLAMLMEDEKLPWYGQLSVHVLDTKYNKANYLVEVAAYENLVSIVRLPGNRTLYLPAKPIEGHAPPGHPTWYGEAFKLGDSTTWTPPDETVEVPYTSRGGRNYTIKIEAWNEMVMRGTKTAPMHEHPFRLVRITWFDEQGQPVFKRPMWLLVLGKRRHELSLPHIRQAYGRRFDLEHFNRFGKQRLLMTAFQTIDVRREENWWQITQLAYVQLWLARYLVEALPRPWERHLPRPRSSAASPAITQRTFGRIIRQFGTPAVVPKPRGYSPGRAKGTRLRPRPRLPVLKKAA